MEGFPVKRVDIYLYRHRGWSTPHKGCEVGVLYQYRRQTAYKRYTVRDTSREMVRQRTFGEVLGCTTDLGSNLSKTLEGSLEESLIIPS